MIKGKDSGHQGGNTWSHLGVESPPKIEKGPVKTGIEDIVRFLKSDVEDNVWDVGILSIQMGISRNEISKYQAQSLQRHLVGFVQNNADSPRCTERIRQARLWIDHLTSYISDRANENTPKPLPLTHRGF